MRTLAFACVLCLGASAWSAPPVEVYGNDPDVSDVSISPDGNKIALLISEKGESGLMILDLTTRKTTGANTSNLKVRGLDWSGPNHVLLYASITTNIIEFRQSKVEFGGVFSIDVRDISKQRQLLANTKGKAIQSSLDNVLAYAGNSNGDVYMAAWINHSAATTDTKDLLLVDGKTGRGRSIARGSPSTRYWVVSPKGHVVARVDHQDRTDVYRVYVPTNDDRRSGFKAIFREETEVANIGVYGATTDEKHLIVSARRSSDREGLFKLSLETGELGEAVFEHELVDMTGVESDPYTGAIVGARYVLDSPEQVFFENDLQSVLLAVRRALPGKAVALPSWSRDRKKFVVYSEGADDPGTYFVFDVDASRLFEVGSTREGIAPADVAKATPFFFKARDGLSIHAFLTVPPCKEAKHLPLVVLPHGGPASRDSTSFDYWAQFIASRGYGVLQVNFRGSSGYGETFQDAGDREFGGKMQNDITDGVKHVIKEGIADPARICIVNGSYGGYAALAGAAFTPELYKCAASIAGISDLKQMLTWERNAYGFDSSTYEYWRKVIGDPDTDGDMIRARSPVTSVDKITAAVMLIHGTDDTVVAFEQSELMAEALEDAEKPFEFVKLEDEDHWASKAKTRTEMLRTLEGFLSKHLGP